MNKGKTGKFNLNLFIAIILFIFTAAGNAAAATYYVSTTGSDSNSGLIGAPFKTIQKAANIVNPGDTVIVKNGIYTDTNGDDAIVKLSRGGTSSSWITFKAENKWGAKLDGQKNATDYGWVFLTGADYIRIEGLEIYGCKSMGIHINQTTSNTYLYRNKIHDIGRLCNDSQYGQAGIYFGTRAKYITIDSNVIHHIGRYGWPGGPQCDPSHPYDGTHDHGLYLNGPYVTVKNNIFYENNSGYDINVK
jgi:hypothetical protein